MNKTDCDVFTCLLAKHLISEECNYDDIKLDQPCDEMAGNLLSLAAAGTKRIKDLPENLLWIFREDVNHNESVKSKLDREFTSAGLNYRQSPTPKDGNCLFHAMGDQLSRMGKPFQTASQLRAGVVCFL